MRELEQFPGGQAHLIIAAAHVAIRFAYPPDEAQQAALEELLHAWYLEGQNEHFGPGFFHSATSLVFEDNLALWHVDVGGASGDALLVLKSRLEGYCQVHVPIREIILGTSVNEQYV